MTTSWVVSCVAALSVLGSGALSSNLSKKPGPAASSVSAHNSGGSEEYGSDYMMPGSEDSGVMKVTNVFSRDPGENQEQAAFMFKIGSTCTCVLIHRDWLVTAQHCLPDVLNRRKQDEQGNTVYPLEHSSIQIVRKKGATSKPAWGTPLKFEAEKAGDINLWRQVEKIIVDPAWKGETMSMYGADLALIKLAPKTEGPQVGYILPVCLPDPQQPDLKGDRSDELFFAGFGRRRLPHCITNMDGPDMYHLCGRPLACTKSTEHRTQKCGLEFIYKNVTQSACLAVPNPSTEHPICKKLAEAKKKSFKNKAFVFDHEMKVLLTTCWPAAMQDKEKGWCTTRSPMDDVNKEPEFDKGWGFCGQEEDQESCDKQIDTTFQNSGRVAVSQLETKHCVDQLEQNLIKENIKVPRADYETLAHLICVGRNVSVNFNTSQAFRMDNKTMKFTKQNLDKPAIDVLVKSNISQYALDGGACFGDSGGPLLKFVKHNGVQKPVLIGVFSFLLWGTCRGRNDPSYYIRVTDYLDSFIFKHVPKNETCLVSAMLDTPKLTTAVVNAPTTKKT